MGKFEGVLLVSDFDDTYSSPDGKISARNLQALDYFRSRGGRFTIATGRSHRTFVTQLGLMPLDAPVVLSNGSALYDFQLDRMLYQTFLPDDAPAHFMALLEFLPSLGLETYWGEEISVWNPNPITDGHMRKVGTDYAIRPLEQMPTPWTKAIVQQEHGLLLQARQWLLERYGALYEAIFSNAYYLEVTRKGSTKGGMVERLLEHLGADPGKLYCVGDNQNDIPMLALSQIPFAPENCAQEVRDWGAQVLCHSSDGVIGDVVEILDRIY